MVKDHKKKLLAAVAGVGVIGALAFTGVALADNGSQGNGVAPQGGYSQQQEGGNRGPGGRHGGFGALHGEFTVKDDSGKYVDRLTQRGTVSSVSATSLTVKSEDGYTKTYVINDDTVVNGEQKNIDEIKSGETVSVTASASGDTATALRVFDESAKPQAPKGKDRTDRPAPPDAPGN